MIRIKSNRKLFYHNKWTPAAELRNRRKGSCHPGARTYFSRWKIEEYFRCKKQLFQFENFRVSKLKAINALNFYIIVCMAFLALASMESETNALKVSIIKTADPIRENVFFSHYRLAKGISSILSYVKQGIWL